MASDKEEHIRTRAYAIWEREGRPDGREHEHWKQAAAEIRNESASGGNASDGLRVSAYNDPTRSPGPVQGGARPVPVGGISSGSQRDGAGTGGGSPINQGSIGIGGGGTGRPSVTPDKGR